MNAPTLSLSPSTPAPHADRGGRLAHCSSQLGSLLGSLLGGAVLAVAPALAVVLLGAGPAAAGGTGSAPAQPPPTLEATGLYADLATKTLAPDVLSFTPQYPLWSDGATKQRWIRLPAGAAIDASDPARWSFPVGTRLWKEFSFERRVETRYLERLADGSWLRAVYLWSADEREAPLAPERGVRGAAESAPGIPYDVPGRADCATCHGGSGRDVLGFGTLQLSPDRDPLAPHAEPLRESDVDLVDLVERGLVRGLPPALAETPFRIAAASPRERAVLGYLHANCGTCHHGDGLLAPLQLELVVDARTGDCRTVSTTVGRASRFRPPGAPAVDTRVVPGHPDLSALFTRMTSREPAVQMPPLATRRVDEVAAALVEAWIREDLRPLL